MKKQNLYLLAFLLIFFAACSNDNNEVEIKKPLLILNQGLFNQNNTSLSAVYLPDTSVRKNVFKRLNGRDLGDTGNDMKEYNGKIYIVVHNSNKIEVTDFSGKNLGTIQIKQPRNITFHGEYAYVTSYDSLVNRIDLKNYKIDKTLKIGAYPEDICEVNNKLYIANSGGLNFPNYDKTVSVVDLKDFSLKTSIEVRMNPSKISKDQKGNIYVISIGNYDNISPILTKISCSTDAVIKKYDYPLQKMAIYENIAYMIVNKTVKVFDLEKEIIINENFLQNYKHIVATDIMTDKITGDLFVMDALNYITEGNIYCFNSSGEINYKLNEVGLNPVAIVIP